MNFRTSLYKEIELFLNCFYRGVSMFTYTFRKLCFCPLTVLNVLQPQVVVVLLCATTEVGTVNGVVGGLYSSSDWILLKTPQITPPSTL